MLVQPSTTPSGYKSASEDTGRFDKHFITLGALDFALTRTMLIFLLLLPLIIASPLLTREKEGKREISRRCFVTLQSTTSIGPVTIDGLAFPQFGQDVFLGIPFAQPRKVIHIKARLIADCLAQRWVTFASHLRSLQSTTPRPSRQRNSRRLAFRTRMGRLSASTGRRKIASTLTSSRRWDRLRRRRSCR